jgi:prepilin-type N-terminal cleavage/methylation domain-containing protein
MNAGRPDRGVTLLELLVVLMILSLILTAAVKTWDVTLERGRSESTTRKLNQLVTAIAGDQNYVVAGHRVDFGFVGDVGRLPNSLSELVNPLPITPPESSRWRGPYLRSTFNESPDGYRTDGWGDTIIYNRDSLFLRSLGGRGIADRTRWQTRYLPFGATELTANDVDGFVVDVRGVTPPLNDTILTNLRVTMYYPFEGRRRADQYPLSLTNGAFSFSYIPQGTHRLEALYYHYEMTHVDTITAYIDVPVYPGRGAHDLRLRLNVDWNDEP